MLTNRVRICMPFGSSAPKREGGVDDAAVTEGDFFPPWWGGRFFGHSEIVGRETIIMMTISSLGPGEEEEEEEKFLGGERGAMGRNLPLPLFPADDTLPNIKRGDRGKRKEIKRTPRE